MWNREAATGTSFCSADTAEHIVRCVSSVYKCTYACMCCGKEKWWWPLFCPSTNSINRYDTKRWSRCFRHVMHYKFACVFVSTLCSIFKPLPLSSTFRTSQGLNRLDSFLLTDLCSYGEKYIKLKRTVEASSPATWVEAQYAVNNIWQKYSSYEHTHKHTVTHRHQSIQIHSCKSNMCTHTIRFSRRELFVYSCCAAKTVYWACCVCVCVCRCAAAKHQWRPSLMTSFVDWVPVGVTNLKRSAEDHGTGSTVPQRDSRIRGITSQRCQLAVRTSQGLPFTDQVYVNLYSHKLIKVCF